MVARHTALNHQRLFHAQRDVLTKCQSDSCDNLTVSDTKMSKVFISYRRTDNIAKIGRIRDWLAQPNMLGPDGVFMDVEGIPIGADFRKHIAHEMDQSDIFLAMVGPSWLETVPARSDDPSDFVRIEIEMALDRHLHVVPILVGKEVTMPTDDILPPSIANFAFLNAELVDPSDRDFPLHMERLCRGLNKLREAREKPKDFRNSQGIQIVGLRHGRFLMGANEETDPKAQANELPEREEEIHHGFWIGKYPVTVEEFGRVMGRSKLDEVLARIPAEQDHRFAHHRQPLKPITQIDWKEADAFCRRLTELEDCEGHFVPPGYVYRLPTEAEWEYACRGGVERQPRYGHLDQIAWTADSGGRFANVGEREPNPFGLHDMLGLVFEWCEHLASDSGSTMIRGGSYHEPADDARASARKQFPCSRRSSRVGMRLVLGSQSI